MKSRIAAAIALSVLLCSLSFASVAASGSTQEKATIDLRRIDISEFFKILSKKMGVTILPSGGVSGRLNMLLNNITYEDALDLIIVSQGFACERRGDVINVMTSAEYEKLYGVKYNERRQFKAFKLGFAAPQAVFSALGQIKSDIGKIILDESSATIFVMDAPERLSLIERAVRKLDQVPQTEVFHLRYASPQDIKTQLEGLSTKGVGEMITDEASKKIIVSDLPDKLKRIEEIVKELDAEPLQVLIKCDIVEINIKNEDQRQINWETIIDALTESKADLDLKGTFPAAASWTVSPTMSTASQLINVGVLDRDKFTVAMKFLETLGDTKINSHPELLVMNNQQGSILVGSREAYVIQTLSQAAGSTISAEDIQFIDVGVKLDVTPAISRDGYITMKIKPQISSVRETITTTLGSRVPIVDTSEVETSVKIKDGATIMVAGLTKLARRDDRTGVPGLMRMPLADIGSSTRSQLKKKTEFAVFLTPHIVKGDSVVAAPPPDAGQREIGLQMQDKLEGMKIVEVH